MSTEYEIISTRVGEPGATYTPTEGINVDALIAGGFIKIKSRQTKKTVTETETVSQDKE
jgi:hypothetical protein